jgi:photosystem II stability/assembly factor-like uncharacterized protein
MHKRNLLLTLNFFIQMKKIFLISALILSVSQSNAQWVKRNFPSGVFKIHQFQWINEDTAYATFETSTTVNLYRTTDQAATWTLISKPTCYSFHFFDFNDGYFWMSNDSFYMTHDGGSTFKAVGNSSPITSNRLGMKFITRNRGFLYGGGEQFGITTDGGHNWNMLSLAPLDVPYAREPSFPDTLHGFCKGKIPIVIHSNDSTAFYYTSDGGKTWQLQYGVTSSSRPFWGTDLQFVSQNTGFIGLEKTNNGGKTWFYSGKGIDTAGSVIYAMHFSDSITGYIVMLPGSKIYKTYDGGKNWLLQIAYNDLSLSGAPDGMSFLNNDVGAIYTLINSTKTLLVTANGGHSSAIKKPVVNEFYFNLYPNPANDKINITATGLAVGVTTLSLRDIFGRIIYSQQTSTIGTLGISFDITRLKPGIYVLELSNQNTNSNRRFMIER